MSEVVGSTLYLLGGEKVETNESAGAVAGKIGNWLNKPVSARERFLFFGMLRARANVLVAPGSVEAIEPIFEATAEEAGSGSSGRVTGIPPRRPTT
jgi:hypothetical protein